jgi:hypothetical protein
MDIIKGKWIDDETWTELFLILYIFFVVYQSDVFANLLHTVVGRMMVVSVLIFYSHLDKYLGLLVCAIIIGSHYFASIPEFFTVIETSQIDTKVFEDPDFDKQKQELISEDPHKMEFVKQQCSDGKLLYKGNEVKPDMMEHIFPQVEFKGPVCNPCDTNCHFSLILHKMSIEEQMLPVSTLI